MLQKHYNIKNKIKYLENRKSLSVEQIEALKSIKIEEFGRIKYTWMMMYKEAEKYHEEFKNLKVPATYSYYDIQGNCVNLGNWINSQRKKYKNNTLFPCQKLLRNRVKAPVHLNRFSHYDIYKNR